MAAGVECPREPNQARRLRTREPGTTLSPDVPGLLFVSVIDASYSGPCPEARHGHRHSCDVAVSEDDDRVNLALLKLTPATKVGQLQEHADGLHRGAGLLDEGDGGRGRPSGSQDVVDHQDA